MSAIAFLGAGAMGEALIRGLLKAGVYAPGEIAAFNRNTARLNELAAELGITAAADAVSLARETQTLVVGVKPQAFATALAPLADVVTAEQTVISIAAGLTTKQIEGYFNADVPVVRVMPNTPCLIGQAASAICLGQHAGENEKAIAHKIFDAVGLAVDVDEKVIDAVTGLSGSGPAYVYLFIEALSDAGVRMGLTRDVATQLAAQTVAGSAEMVLQTGKHPGVLKDMVTSPGGTTIAGIHALEQNAFRGTVIDAVQAAVERAREMSKP